MRIRIAHARSSETGTIDGVPGDQTGREVMISDNTGGWTSVIRACDPGQRIYIAAYAAQIAVAFFLYFGKVPFTGLNPCVIKR